VGKRVFVHALKHRARATRPVRSIKIARPGILARESFPLSIMQAGTIASALALHRGRRPPSLNLRGIYDMPSATIARQTALSCLLLLYLACPGAFALVSAPSILLWVVFPLSINYETCTRGIHSRQQMLHLCVTPLARTPRPQQHPGFEQPCRCYSASALLLSKVSSGCQSFKNQQSPS
jgi:hypothetical protein